MTSSHLPDSMLQPSTEINPENLYQLILFKGPVGTDPELSSQCLPVTLPPIEISWEPVILPLLERLSELRSLPVAERWPRADWPDEQAFWDAGKFTERLPVPLKAKPHISLADDGEVNFAWSHEGTHIDLGFYGTNTFSYYARDKNGGEWFGDEIPVASALPKELKVLLAV